MNLKTTLALLIVLGGLAIYMAFNRKPSTDDTSKPAEARKLLNVKPEDVIKVSIAPAQGKTITVEKTGSDWTMTSPFDVPAETPTIDQFVRDTTALTSQGQLDAAQASSDSLAHPAYTVTLTTKTGSSKLLIAEKSLGNSLTVLVDGNKQPDLIDVAYYTSLDRSPSTYRRTHLLSVLPDNVKQLELTRGKETIRLEKNGNDWKMLSPTPMPADNGTLQTVVFGLSNMNAVGFDDNDTLADAGLNHPRITIWYSTDAPTTQPSSQPSTAPTTHHTGTTIKLGGYEDVTQKNILATIDDGPVVLLPASTIDTFRKTQLDLRDKSVVMIDPARVESFGVAVTPPADTQPSTAPSTIHRVPLLPYAYALQRRKQRPLGPELPDSRPTSAPSTQPLSTWEFKSGDPANDNLVEGMLGGLRPLRAEDYIAHPEANPQGARFVVTVHTGPAPDAPPADYTITIIDPGGDQKLIGLYGGLTFHVDRFTIPNLESDFKTPPANPNPAPTPQMMPDSMPPMMPGRQ